MDDSRKEYKQKGINVCRRICSLTDELRDLWLCKQSAGSARSFMSLTVNQHRMLRAVWRMTSVNSEGIILRNLADKLGLSSSAVSVMVESLVQRGYLLRTTALHDRRKVLIRLTDAGVAECNGSDDFFCEISREFVSKCDPEKFECFENIIDDFISFLINKRNMNK